MDFQDEVAASKPSSPSAIQTVGYLTTVGKKAFGFPALSQSLAQRGLLCFLRRCS